MSLKVQVKLIDPRLVDGTFSIPEYKTEGSAAMDLLACIDSSVVLKAGQVKLVSSGMQVYIGDPNYAYLLLPRSGIGHRNGIVLGNLVGLCDSDYQGVALISLWNRSNEDFEINPGDRIAQMMFVPVVRPEFEIVEEFHEISGRGEGGFGHTGR